MFKRLFTLFLVTLLLCACGGGSGSSQGGATLPPGEGGTAALASIEIGPEASALAPGETLALHATGVYSDGSRQDITEQALWSSSDELCLKVENAAGSCARASALRGGQVTVTARLGEVAATRTLQVSAAPLLALEIATAQLSLPAGATQQLVATGLYYDGSRDVTELVAWASSSPLTATVGTDSAARGLVHALTPGEALVEATLEGKGATAAITVTAALLLRIDVAPAQASRPAGLAQPFSAVGTYSDGSVRDLTAEVDWQSLVPEVAAFAAAQGAGVAAAKDIGQAPIVASLGEIEGQAHLEVTAAVLESLLVDPPQLSLPAGVPQQLTALGHYSDGSVLEITSQASWSSSAPVVASVGSEATSRGKVTALTPGSATVTAETGGLRAECGLSVTPALLVSLSISPVETLVPSGLFARFKAMGTYSDGTTADLTEAAVWTVSDPQVATSANAFGQKGLVATKAPGTATIAAAVGPIEATASLTVSAAWPVVLQITPEGAWLAPGSRFPFAARCLYSDGTIQDVTELVDWKSYDEAVARIEKIGPAIGELATHLAGTVPIEAIWQKLQAATLVTVAPLELELWQNPTYPMAGAWEVAPLGSACEDEVCVEFSSGQLSGSAKVVHGQYRLRAGSTPLTLRASAADLNAVTSAGFGGIADGQVLVPGEEIVFTLESGLTGGAQALLQWRIEFEGLSVPDKLFFKTLTYRSN